MKAERCFPTDTGRTVRLVTFAGLLVNLALSGVKFAAGVLGHSQAVVADAVHSLSDTVSDLAVIVGSLYWSKPADRCHHYGHRRIETIITLFVGFMLIAAGLGIIRQAVISMQMGPARPPGVAALAAALLSILSKEALYRWTKGVGERLKSPAMVANAWHHRTDAMSSVPALVSVGGGILFPGCWYLDAAGAIVVSLFILYAAYEIMRPGVMELLDGSASPEVLQQIRRISEDTDGVLQIHNLRSRFSGAMLHLDLHVVVDGDITVRQGHDIAEDVKSRIIGGDLNVVDVVVHVEPSDHMK